MTDRHSFLSTDHLNRDLDESPKTVDRVLNAAIVHAEIAENFEKYLEIFEAFYADDIDSWKSESKFTSLRLPGPASSDGGNRGPVSIYSTDRNARGWCTRDTFCVDARVNGRVRCNLHSELVHPAEMERLAGCAREPLSPPAKRRPFDLR